MTRISILLLLAPLLAVPVRAVDLGGRDRISDPDMRAEMQKVQEANLENAMLRGLDRAGEAAGYLRALMFGARADLQGALKAMSPLVREGQARPGSLEERADNLIARSQRLRSRALKFDRDARLAQLKLAERDDRALFLAATSYRADDRKGDLGHARSFIAEARRKMGKVRLDEARDGAVSAADSFIEEARSVRAEIVRALELVRAGKERPDHIAPLKKLGSTLETFDGRLAALAVERDLLRADLLLLQYDDEAFERGR